MIKSLITYFSLGGTTAKVSESIAIGLRSEGHQVDLYNIKGKQQPEIGKYDLIGIGSPVYFFRPPSIVIDYLNSLPVLEGLPSFTFVLHGTYRFDANKYIQRILTRKGTQNMGYFHCYGADFWLGYLKEGYLFSPDHPTPAELSMAEDFGSQVAGRVAGKPFSLDEEDQSPTLVYHLERFLTNRWFVEQVYSRMLKVNKESCDNSCRLCKEICPQVNISEDKDGYPVWGRNCLLCLTCQLKCPRDAITSHINSPLSRSLTNYNLRHASRDPSLDNVRVTHSKGITQRI